MRPSDLPEARVEMLDYYGSVHGQHMWMTIAAHEGFMDKKVSEDRAAKALRDEAVRWKMAELFWVTEDMTHLATEASRTMPAYSLHVDDLPAPYGFMRFARPVGQSLTGDPDRPALDIVGILWGPVSVEGKDGALQPGVWLSFYTDADEVATEARCAGLPPEDVRIMRSIRGPFVYDDEMILMFGEFPVEEHWRTTHYVVRCAWLLMQQAVAAVTPEPLSRPTRRRLAKRQAPTDVRLVKLRHAASEGAPEGEGRDYHHRWFVRGHWRKQWYPSQERHVPIWISPHVKGPEGAPLLGGEKVYVWER